MVVVGVSSAGRSVTGLRGYLDHAVFCWRLIDVILIRQHHNDGELWTSVRNCPFLFKRQHLAAISVSIVLLSVLFVTTLQILVSSGVVLFNIISTRGSNCAIYASRCFSAQASEFE